MADSPVRGQVTFTVDTHLFRELGALLVGRDATALLELVKNAYDADATEVTVTAEKLGVAGEGVIVISDNGHGMLRPDFTAGFLRIASRAKDTGDRRSLLLKRRFTGAKGIGRLAAHKLARRLDVDSTPAKALAPGKSRRRVIATIDWDKIESVETLDAIPAGSIEISDKPVPTGAPSGTTITLRALRRIWHSSDRERFVAEVSGFEPLGILINPLPQKYLTAAALFDRPRLRDNKGRGAGGSFHLSLGGEFGDIADLSEQAILSHVEWLVEVRVDGPNAIKRIAIVPTIYAEKDDNPTTLIRNLELTEAEAGLTYDVRILVRPGQIPKKLGTWQQRSHGVRVFMEGFRVLPYGEPGDDWLEVDRAVTDRVRRPKDEDIARLASSIFAQALEGAGLSLLPNKHYYGGVFLTSGGAPGLQMLVNREGFVPSPAFESIAKTVRSALWLATYQMKSGRKRAKTPPVTAATIASETAALQALTAELSSLANPEGLGALRARLGEVERHALTLKGMAHAIVEEAALLRDTAAVGLQLSRFVHELNALLGSVISIQEALDELKGEAGLPRKVRATLADVRSGVDGLRRSFERYAAYFGGLLSNTGRRRRAVQPLRERIEETIDIVTPAIRDSGQVVSLDCSDDLRTGPMFAAELRTVFLNLLTNATKAAGRGGKISVAAKRVRQEPWVEVVVANTGIAVDLAEAEQWFEPFRTTTASPDPVLGQGMGLGLPIVRMIINEHGGTVAFVRPERGYRTAVRCTLPLKP